MPNAIILLHGTSSTGKTSTAKALQQTFAGPLIYFSLDGWITQHLSDRYYEPAKRIEDIKQDSDVKKGTHFLLPNTDENPLPWPMVGSGNVSDDAIDVMYQAIIDFYQKGYWIILDHVLLTSHWREHFLTSTKNCRRILIQMTCDEKLLAQRESLRGDRMPGVYLALAQTIHQNIPYDYTIDTSHITPTDTVGKILNFPKIKELM